MFQTSQDIFYIVASSCIAILTIVLTITIIYVASILKKVNHVVGLVHSTVERVDALVTLIREKVNKGADMMTLGISGAMKLAEYMDSKKKKKNKNKK